MPFEERSIVSQREEFCRLALAEGANRRELCRRFGIEPATGYLWLGRYREAGREGLEDRSRRPLSCPWRTPEEVEARVLEVRREHPAWGGRKIERVLHQAGLEGVPSPSTITEILRRHQLLDGPRAEKRRDFQRFEHPDPNALWQMDFKGHFRLTQGRCHPLTVLDDHSRYALEIGACANEQGSTVQARLQRLFERYGLPRRILADNGSPWGTSGSPQRHTVLTVWLLDLEVQVIHGRPYHPQTQGKDERFHRTLKAEVLDGRTFEDLDQAQTAFDLWREVYNTHRPHEALGMDVPASRYRMSPRPMPKIILPPDYEPQAHVRMVKRGGWFTFHRQVVLCPQAFVGRHIALRPSATDGLFDLCYRSHVLAQIDLRKEAKNVQDVPEQTFSMSPV
jgi:transposase InsO family protein